MYINNGKMADIQHASAVGEPQNEPTAGTEAGDGDNKKLAEEVKEKANNFFKSEYVI